MCSKRIYSFREAGEVLNNAKRNRRRRQEKIPVRKYYCEECKQYHLTSIKYLKESFKDFKETEGKSC